MHSNIHIVPSTFCSPGCPALGVVLPIVKMDLLNINQFSQDSPSQTFAEANLNLENPFLTNVPGGLPPRHQVGS